MRRRAKVVRDTGAKGMYCESCERVVDEYVQLEMSRGVTCVAWFCFGCARAIRRALEREEAAK